MNYCALKRMGMKTIHAIGWSVLGLAIIRFLLWEIFKAYAEWCCSYHSGVDYVDAFMYIISIFVFGLFCLWTIIMSLIDWYNREVKRCSSKQPLKQPRPKPKVRRRRK